MTDKLLDELAPLTGRINETMETLLEDDDISFRDLGRYSFEGGGKRLRPLIFCLTWSALGGEVDQKILKLSTAFEFLHMATLVHDDIVDQTDIRRGRPAAHIAYGVPESVLAGDYFLAKSAEIILMSDNIETPRFLVKILREISLGELEQLKVRHDTSLSQEKYFDIIFKKTALLIEASAVIAGIEARASSEIIAALSGFGRKVGLAFQIMDDILDYDSDIGSMGKPVGRDLDEGKITLPFILAREALSEPLKKELMSLGEAPSRTALEMDRVKFLIEKVCGVANSRKKASGLADEAEKLLLVIPESLARESLSAIARFTVNRTF